MVAVFVFDPDEAVLAVVDEDGALVCVVGDAASAAVVVVLDGFTLCGGEDLLG